MNGLDAKFRAWDSVKKEYPMIGFQLLGEVTVFDLLNQYNLEHLIKLEIEEWTGLTDKNDKLVYEGDLFKSTMDENFIFRVWKVEGGFGSNVYVPIWQRDIRREYPFPLLPLADEQTASWFKGNCYVIGNIKQNPEYLELDYLESLIKLYKDEKA